MDFESLKIFCAVAAELGITQAAAKLGRVPSNVTTRIQNLEADLGAELFVRPGKRLHLSTAGERFLGYAQRLLALEAEARQVVAGAHDSGTLRIGSMESTAASRLPAPLAAFSRDRPDVRLEVTTGASQGLLDSLRIGRLDCAFVALPAGLDAAPALAALGLQAEGVWTEELLLLLPPHEQATSVSEVRTRTLAAFRPGCAYRGISEQALGIGTGPRWAIQEMGSYHAMVAAVAAGTCVSLLPRSVLDLATVPAGLRALPVCRAVTWLATRAGYGGPLFDAFRQALPRAVTP